MTHQRSSTSLPFPSVTFCNLNTVRSSVVAGTHADFLKWKTGENESITDNHILMKTIEEFVDVGILTLEEMFIWCAWENKPFPCASRMRELVTRNTKCFTVNAAGASTAPLMTSGAGEENALMLLIDIHQEENIHFDVNYIRYGAGVDMTVHAQDAWPMTSQQGVALAPGLSHFVSMTYEETTRLSTPYAKEECISSDDQPDYNYQKCMTGCRIEAMFHYCDCNDYSDCPYATIFKECYNYNRREILQEKCSRCLRNCEESRYNLVTSSAVFPAKGHINDLIYYTGLNRTTEQDIRDNVLLVKLYFSTLNYEEHVGRESFDRSTLVANIGGFLGLFLGASFVTLCEIGEVLIHLAIAGVRKITCSCQRRGPQNVKPNVTSP